MSGKLEVKKQNSLYVGLPKVKNKIVKKGRIINPMAFRKDEALTLIKSVHNEIISTTIRMYVEESYLDSSYLENFLTLDFINGLIDPKEYLNKYNQKLYEEHIFRK